MSDGGDDDDHNDDDNDNDYDYDIDDRCLSPTYFFTTERHTRPVLEMTSLAAQAFHLKASGIQGNEDN